MVRPLSSLAKFSFVISNIRFPLSRHLAETDRCSRDCATVDMQVIGRKAHPPTSLNGWVGCQNDAVCESSCLTDNLGFPRMQAVSVEVLRCLHIGHASILDQAHGLKLELPRELPSLHDPPPVPSKHLTRCLRNRVQARPVPEVLRGPQQKRQNRRERMIVRNSSTMSERSTGQPS